MYKPYHRVGFINEGVLDEAMTSDVFTNEKPSLKKNEQDDDDDATYKSNFLLFTIENLN